MKIAGCHPRHAEHEQAHGREDLAALRRLLHPNCVVCSPLNLRGLGVRFVASADGAGVTADLCCDPSFEGYAGVVLGGIVSALLDGAMANCLLLRGRVAHTADLMVRFRQHVVVGRPATVHATVERSRGRLHLVRGVLLQDGVVKATASARFMETQGAKRGGLGRDRRGPTGEGG